MEKAASAPTAERLLSLLADLYADQMGVKIEYRITERKEHDGTDYGIPGSACNCDSHGTD